MPQAQAGAAQVQALKQQRMRAAGSDKAAPSSSRTTTDDEDNVLTHWVRSAADMRLKVGVWPHPQPCQLEVNAGAVHAVCF
jgi:hypothetical protein